jgi:predicted RNase H-like HicB family nuclease
MASNESSMYSGTKVAAWEVTGMSPATVPVPSTFEPSPALAKALRYAGQIELRHPLVVTIESDDDAYIARCSDVPQLFGLGESVDEAKNALGREIESLWHDLNEDDELTDEWRATRDRLSKIIGDAK